MPSMPADFTPYWGPHICAACFGVGWMRYDVPFGDEHFGQLKKCDICHQVDNQRLNRALGEAWSLSALDPNATDPPSLAKFRPYDASARTMLDAAIAFTANPSGWLTIWGPFGSGKSHLAEGIARLLLSKRVPCLYTRAPGLFEYLGAVERKSGEDVDYDGRKRWTSEIAVLIVDELNRERDSEAARKLRLALLDTRYQHAIHTTGGATVLISNDHPDTWHDQAIASRAMDQRFVQCQAPATDYRRIAKGYARPVTS